MTTGEYMAFSACLEWGTFLDIWLFSPLYAPEKEFDGKKLKEMSNNY